MVSYVPYRKVHYIFVYLLGYSAYIYLFDKLMLNFVPTNDILIREKSYLSCSTWSCRYVRVSISILFPKNQTQSIFSSIAYNSIL